MSQSENNPNNERYTNRFSILNSNVTNLTAQLEEHVNNTEDKVRKPPPVYIENVVNYSSMINCIQTTISKDEFVCKTLANNSVKVNTKSADSYRKLIHLLKQGNVEYYMYQPRDERAYGVVIKILDATISTDDIKDELQSIEFKIRNVVNIRNWKTKQPLALFFTDQEPSENNKNIYELKSLLGTKIIVEPPRKKREIPQCHRYQEYGHTKSYCIKAYSCVKCTDNHQTEECTKSKDLLLKCALCGGLHPANYKATYTGSCKGQGVNQ